MKAKCLYKDSILLLFETVFRLLSSLLLLNLLSFCVEVKCSQSAFQGNKIFFKIEFFCICWKGTELYIFLLFMDLVQNIYFQLYLWVNLISLPYYLWAIWLVVMTMLIRSPFLGDEERPCVTWSSPALCLCLLIFQLIQLLQHSKIITWSRVCRSPSAFQTHIVSNRSKLWLFVFFGLLTRLVSICNFVKMSGAKSWLM